MFRSMKLNQRARQMILMTITIILMVKMIVMVTRIITYTIVKKC